MGMDLSYWKYKEGTDLSPREVYQTACCDGLPAEGLEELTIAVASNWVGILVLAAVGTGVWSVLRRRKKRKTPPAPPADGE